MASVVIKPNLIRSKNILTAAEFKTLKNKKIEVHPGNFKNMQVYWPLYLETMTTNVHVYNYILVYNPASIMLSKLYLRQADTPVSKSYQKSDCGIKLTAKRFVYIILIFVNPEDQKRAHANGLLYDTTTQILDRYEPHGSGNPIKYTNIDTKTSKLFKAFIKTNLGLHVKRFNQPRSVCPMKGWQTRQGISRFKNLIFDRQWKIDGYCAAWSLYFILLRAKNPHIAVKTIQERAFKEYEKTSDYIHEFYYDFLRWKINLLK